MSVLHFFFFFFFFLLSSTTSLDVQSGAGYSLSFQSLNTGSDIATLWNYFGCDSYWPTTQISFNFWLRCLAADTETNGIFCGSSIFIQSYGNTGGYNHVYSPLVTMSSSNLNSILQNAGENFPAWLDFFNWHMYTFQTDTVTDTTWFYIDGVLYSNITTVLPTFAFCGPTLSGTLLNIGRNFFVGTDSYVQQAQGRGFFGEIDEISLWNRTLSSAEISHMYTTKLRGDEYGLLTYWDFNEGNGLVARNLAFTGSAYDLHLGQTKNAHVFLDATTNTITDFTVPTFAPSQISITVNQSTPSYLAHSTPLLVFSVLQPNNATFINFNTTNPNINYIQILNAPTYGTLYQSNGISVGTAITNFPANISSSHTLVYSVPYEPLFNESSGIAFDSFSYLLVQSDGTSITNGTVNCIPNILPWSTNETLTAQSGLTLFTTPLTVNPRGGLLTWKLITLPEHGVLYQVYPNGSLSSPITASGDVTHLGGYLAYIPPQLGGGAGYDNFTYVVIDSEGSSSPLFWVIFNVNPFDYLPVTTSQSIVVNENDRIVIDLQSFDANGQLVATSISKLPSHGQLYLYNEDGSLGQEITKVANPYDGVTVASSYATEVTGVSSFWGDGGASYSPWQILGPQDVFTYGDSALTWCPLTLTGDQGYAQGGANGLNFSWDPTAAYTKYGYTEYIELKFNYSVYAMNVEVGMCRGMGSLVNVLAMSPEGWESIWSSPASKQVLQDCAATKSYYTYQISLCQTTYLTNALRLEFDTRDIGDWAETDYVQFVGAIDLRPAVFEWNKTKVVYVPTQNYFGTDTFEFIANDCPYSGLRNSNPGVINITVNQIAVPPIVSPIRNTVTLGKEGYIYLQNFSEDVNGGQISKYEILTLPKYGQLYSVDEDIQITKVPMNISGGTLRYATDYWQWEGSVVVSFEYKVYAVLASTQNATVTIDLQIPATENPALSWIMLLIILFLTIPTYPLLIARRDIYPLRITSYVLNLAATTGVLLFANIPLQVIAFSNYPCWLYYFCYMLSPTIFATPILVSLYRHHHVYQLTRVKRRIARSDKGSSHHEHHHQRGGPTAEDLEQVAYLRKLTSEGRLLMLTLAGCLIPLVISLALIPESTGTFGLTYCHMGPVVEYCFLVYWLIYTAAIGFGLYYVRKDHELTGFRRHLFYTELTAIFTGFLYLIVFNVTTSSQRFASFALLFTIAPLVYQFLALSRPAIQTFPFLRKPTKSADGEGGEPLSEVIITHKGFSWYLEFTMAEFSQESPLAWKAIQNFKSKTSYEGMRDIFSKYFEERAPLLVNLAASSLRDLRVVCERTTRDTPLQQLQGIYDGVQMELLELMQQDSYMRFIASDYYQKYKRNEQVPRHDSHTVSSQTHKEDYEGLPTFSKPGIFGKISPDTSQHDTLAVSTRAEESKETSLVEKDRGESIIGEQRGDDKLTISIPGLSGRPESPYHANGGSSTPSASSNIAEPSSLGFNIEMTSRPSDAHLNHAPHETVAEEPEDGVTDDQGSVF